MSRYFIYWKSPETEIEFLTEIYEKDVHSYDNTVLLTEAEICDYYNRGAVFCFNADSEETIFDYRGSLGPYKLYCVVETEPPIYKRVSVPRYGIVKIYDRDFEQFIKFV